MSLLTIELFGHSGDVPAQVVSILGTSHTVGNRCNLDASVISPVGRCSVSEV